ncbi:MAG TPA: malate dehydrogenase [Candidatus Saccharicenans sp.]|nr:malate dehydrogenase [Candidatus Saccharicenans sp.]HOL44993.1 malate dehydrogenase [Candidatus Saccharicenans sp.]HPP23269.1 malate dehydrogenase [Candidatus Saccharicenans sp.]HQE63742.1 malate dehydrogenase [Candidatus Saccharicenans sp.]
MRKKIALIGGGQIGQILAMLAAQKELGDIVILDVPEYANVAKGKALDLMEMAPHGNYDANIIGTSDYKDIEGADVVIVTAGKPREAGMTREDLLNVNIKIITDVANGVKQYAPRAFCIIVTNPLDAMVYVFHKITGFPKNQVVGMAGTLDTARWRAFIAMELGVSVADISGTVLGGHGPDMVPLPRLTTIGGVPLTELATQEQIERLINRTREAGTEIVKLFGKGSAFFSPAWSAIVIAESHLKDKRRILPCAALCEGEYGVQGLFIGVPCLISAKGMEKIYEIKLTEEEKAQFAKTIASVSKTVAECKI